MSTVVVTVLGPVLFNIGSRCRVVFCARTVPIVRPRPDELTHSSSVLGHGLTADPDGVRAGPAAGGEPLQVLALCRRAGLVKLGHVALDGAKVRANASKHRAMSYRRMKEREAQLAAEVEELLSRAEEVDAEEDRRYGQDRRGDELPQELAFREGRLEKIREAMASLEGEVQASAEAEGKEHPSVPEDRSQRNFTDAESRIMPAPGGQDFVQAYNCQAVVDSANQVIVAARATNMTSDKQQAVTMMEKTIDNVGAVPREVSADAGYYSTKAVEEIHALGVEPFIAPDKTRHGRVPPPAPRGRIPGRLSPRDRMRRKLQTRRGRQRYSLRMETVEPVFGQIKQGRGFRQFLLRGLEKVNGERSLICTGHNLLKLFRSVADLPDKARVTRSVQRISDFAEIVNTVLLARRSGSEWLQPAPIAFAACSPRPGGYVSHSSDRLLG